MGILFGFILFVLGFIIGATFLLAWAFHSHAKNCAEGFQCRRP